MHEEHPNYVEETAAETATACAADAEEPGRGKSEKDEQWERAGERKRAPDRAKVGPVQFASTYLRREARWRTSTRSEANCDPGAPLRWNWRPTWGTVAYPSHRSGKVRVKDMESIAKGLAAARKVGVGGRGRREKVEVRRGGVRPRRAVQARGRAEIGRIGENGRVGGTRASKFCNRLSGGEHKGGAAPGRMEAACVRSCW